MRVVLVVVGTARTVTGAIWILQGVGIAKGSFMTNQSFWTWMGVVAVVLGVPLLARGLRRN